MTDTPKTICVKCRYCTIIEDNGVWYNYFCSHPSLVKKVTMDPVTGITPSSPENLFPNCREINIHADCKLYEEK